MSDYDLIVAGGGLVGASLAAALHGSGLRVAVIEAAAPGSAMQPSFDERQTALAPSSRRFFEALGLWRDIAAEAAPIRAIHVSERGRFAATRMYAGDEGLDALGHVAPNRVLGRVLRPAMEKSATCYTPATVTGVSAGEDTVHVDVSGADGDTTLSARLLAVADGSASPLCEQLGVPRRNRDYGQTAVIANVGVERGDGGWAFERFTPEGPLAMLPAGQGRYAAVWTLPHERAEAMAALDEATFLDALQRAFGWRLGRLVAAGARARYPLRAIDAVEVTGARTVVLGNAAHTLHPVAGQGFNLALRDVAELAERAGAAVAAGGDCGADDILAGYAVARRGDVRRTSSFTDVLVRGFSNRLPGITAARGAALAALELLPAVRRTLITHAMGRAGRQPRLARGLPLWEGR
ncbi:2-octaprenyl-6-methoxyphenol hydroxylase [wastewater metagenome]|uniref:2-octaprenyl-6-methoxyphenol hydroxylase n=2 Tax=unclassified sequences TaxID=12908 RepID=A0A5B8RF69_9ZZZZ|nr:MULTISPECIES: 2-octaprenyl-6-methoxyphenyl hydroxylase [Arhodomonas]MCS4502951.1 2-octaprenyl-6-methoxyphenyl hydroxylase [Arhodomonas aquaeolei]QEA06182.1 2-octaprenyl-6-methoxyphenol hydroxylase [uncultured organism]